MISFDLFFSRLNEVDSFLQAVDTVPCALILRSGSQAVDGKSLMGILSLDLSRVLTLEAEGTDQDAARLSAAVDPFLA